MVEYATDKKIRVDKTADSVKRYNNHPPYFARVIIISVSSKFPPFYDSRNHSLFYRADFRQHTILCNNFALKIVSEYF